MNYVLKNSCITAQTGNSFLDSCTARVNEGNYRGTHFQSHFLDLGNFFCMYDPQRSAHYCEILCIGKNQSSVHLPVSDYYAVAVRPFNFSEFDWLVSGGYKRIYLFKCGIIEKKIYTFMRCELTFFMLLFSLLRTILFFYCRLTLIEGFVILTR